MKILETRTRDGLIYRRKEHDDGRRITTVEIPLCIYNGLSSETRRKDRLEKWLRGEASRARQMRIIAGIESKTKLLAIADAEKVSVKLVQDIQKKLATNPSSIKALHSVRGSKSRNQNPERLPA